MLNLYDTLMPMRNIPGHILLCFALALRFCFVAAAFPQGDDYDLALDKYARICDRCVELRTGVESGQSVSTEELKSLLSELSSLRKTLSNASGRMSEAQAERFEAIKAKYLQGMRTFVKKPGRPVFNPVPKIYPVTEPVEVTSQAFGFEALRQAQSLRQALRPEEQAQRPDTSARRLNIKAGLRNRGSSTDKAQSASAGSKIAIMADAGIFPVPSYGAMGVATWNRIGAYVHYRGDFRKNEYSYTCTSDGVTEYGRIWATGDSRRSRTVATAGFVMFPSHHFGFYAGAGLTSYRLCWEDASGEWVNVEDKSFGNFAVDAGMFLKFKPLILSLGVNSDFFGHADLQLGVGICF